MELIEREIRYFRITKIARLEKSLPDPVGADLNAYTKLKNKPDSHFLSQKNKQYARYMLLNMKPKSATMPHVLERKQQSDE